LKIADKVKEAALRFGVGVYSATGIADGRIGDCAILAPPYTITTEEIDLLVDRLGNAIDTVF
jgi:adenosylmethionine-8-amino-7-oxononanoate aminotransferase